MDYIITKSVSRFARNTVDCLDHVRQLKARGIGVYFEEQNIDTLKCDSELYLVIYAGFAQSESESMSKNITWSYRKNFEDGKCIYIYKKLLGYKKGADGTPEIVPEEAAIVERIFNMFLAGMTAEGISNVLKAEKIEVPGKELNFSKKMILGILQNEKYCGDCILQKTVTVDCISKSRKKNEGEAPMYLVENSHQAIVSREVFNRVQEEISRRKALPPQSKKKAVTASGKYSKYALTEVLRCGECGSRYKRVTWTSSGKKQIVWRCVSRLDYGKKYCKDSITVKEVELQEAIVRAIRKFNEEDDRTYIALMKATIGDALGITGNTEEVEFLERRIEALNKRMVQIVSASVQAGESVEHHEDEFRRIADEIDQLKRRIEAAQEACKGSAAEQERLKEIQATIDSRAASVNEYDDTIVRQMIECIRVYHDGRLEIIFGGGYEIAEHL